MAIRGNGIPKWNTANAIAVAAKACDVSYDPDSRTALTDEQFDQWLEMNASIVLNSIPVRYRAAESSRTADASRP